MILLENEAVIPVQEGDILRRPYPTSRELVIPIVIFFLLGCIVCIVFGDIGLKEHRNASECHARDLRVSRRIAPYEKVKQSSSHRFKPRGIRVGTCSSYQHIEGCHRPSPARGSIRVRWFLNFSTGTTYQVQLLGVHVQGTGTQPQGIVDGDSGCALIIRGTEFRTKHKLFSFLLKVEAQSTFGRSDEPMLLFGKQHPRIRSPTSQS